MTIKDAYIEDRLALLVDTLDSDHVLDNMEYQADTVKALWAHIQGLHEEIHELNNQLAMSRTATIQHALDIEGNSINIHALIDDLSRLEKLERWMQTLSGQFGQQGEGVSSLANRVRVAERALTQHALDIEGNSVNIQSLVEEVFLHAMEPDPMIITAPLSAGELAQAQALAPSFDPDTSALALYGGEQ